MREILECLFEGRPIRDEYLIVEGGRLAGVGAHSYSEGNTTGGSEEAARFRAGDAGGMRPPDLLPPDSPARVGGPTQGELREALKELRTASPLHMQRLTRRRRPALAISSRRYAPHIPMTGEYEASGARAGRRGFARRRFCVWRRS